MYGKFNVDFQDGLKISQEYRSTPGLDDDWYEIPEEIVDNQLHVLDDGVVRSLTYEEFELFASQQKTNEFKYILKREVGAILSEFDWVVLRHMEQRELGQTTSLTELEYQAVLSYKRYLRDLSSQETFDFNTFTFEQFSLQDRFNFEKYNMLKEFVSSMTQ
jgi:hypothetical protein